MACCSSWKTVSCCARSRLMSATVQATSGRDAGARASGRAAMRYQRAARPAGAPGSERRRHAHFLLGRPALAQRLRQPVDRLGAVGIAGEDPLDRADVALAVGADQVGIGAVGIDDAPIAVGDEHALRPSHRRTPRVRSSPGRAAAEADEADRAGKQREDADDGKNAEEAEDERLGAVGLDQARSRSRRRRARRRGRSAGRRRSCARNGRRPASAPALWRDRSLPLRRLRRTGASANRSPPSRENGRERMRNSTQRPRVSRSPVAARPRIRPEQHEDDADAGGKKAINSVLAFSTHSLGNQRWPANRLADPGDIVLFIAIATRRARHA